MTTQTQNHDHDHDHASSEKYLSTYFLGLLEQAGFTEEDNIPALLQDLEGVFLDRMNAKILAHIPEEKWEEASDLLTQDDPTARENFVKMYITDYDAFLETVLDEFAQEYLANMADEEESDEADDEDSSTDTEMQS